MKVKLLNDVLTGLISNVSYLISIILKQSRVLNCENFNSNYFPFVMPYAHMYVKNVANI